MIQLQLKRWCWAKATYKSMHIAGLHWYKREKQFKIYCGIRNQKVVVTGKKEEGEWIGNRPNVLYCGSGHVFYCLSDAFNWHRCLSIVSTDHLTTYESFYFMLCITRFKEKDSSDITEVFQKERSPWGSLYTHCGICSLLTQYRAEVSSGKGKGHLPWHLPGTCYHRTKEAATPGPKYKHSLK